MIALLLLLATAPADPVLRDLEGAFEALRDKRRHALGRRLLLRATARFDDTDLDGSDVEKAFASDRSKPYRGRPHERVLAHVTLAALEIERGRCDLALPELKSAAFFDLKASIDDDSDAVVVHALLLRCLIELRTSSDEIEAVRAAVDDVAVAAAVTSPGALLVLRGRGPRFVAAGARGERVVVEASADDDDNDDDIVIRLGGRSAAVVAGREIAVWSSLQQASSVRGRPFEQLLAERARANARSEQLGQRQLDDSRRRLRGARSNSDVVAAGFVAAAGAGLLGLSAVVDERVDERFVHGLPGRAVLVSLPAP